MCHHESRGKQERGLRCLPLEAKVVIGRRGRIKGGLDLISET